MKTAICLSGIPRGNIDRNLEHARFHFKDADLFLSTWVNQVPYRSTSFIHQEPNTVYHPYKDCLITVPHPKFEHYKQIGMNGKGQEAFSRTIHHCKQILGHAYLLLELPLEYDMIIRMRYDTFLSLKVDFSSYLNRSYTEHRAIGFGTRYSRHPSIDILKEIPRIYPSHTMAKEISQDWGWYLMDPLIFHPRSLFDTNLAITLHQEQKLLPAEYGWYQILSKPYQDNHLCVYGGAQIEKYLQRQ